jgi:hypothetical protein
MMADSRRKVFLAGLERGLSVTGAAAAAGIPRSLVYKWRGYGDFAAAWDMAEAAGADLLEDEALRRVMEGVEKPVFWRGEQVGTVRTYNDRLLMLLLQRRKPEREPDKEALHRQLREHESFVSDLVRAQGACDRRIVELINELNEARRKLAAATPGAPEPELIPVALPYDEAELFGEEAMEEPDDADDEADSREEADTDSPRPSVSTCLKPVSRPSQFPSPSVSTCLPPPEDRKGEASTHPEPPT